MMKSQFMTMNMQDNNSKQKCWSRKKLHHKKIGYLAQSFLLHSREQISTCMITIESNESP